MVLHKFHSWINTLALYFSEPFTLLDNKKHRWILVIFSGMFSILFMNLFVPFNVNTWDYHQALPQYLALSRYGILGMLVLFISQFYLRPLFKFNHLTVKKFLYWFALEVLMLALVMHLFYGNMNATGWDFFRALGLSLQYTGLVIMLPYSTVLLYLAVQKQQEHIRQTASVSMKGSQTLSIVDENEKLALTVNLNSLLFLKSEDNYVSVFYLKDKEIKKEIVRTSLKKLEQEIPIPPLLRTHRSYMVNMDQLAIVNKKHKGYEVWLHGLTTQPIPVSAGYKNFFEQMIR